MMYFFFCSDVAIIAGKWGPRQGLLVVYVIDCSFTSYSRIFHKRYTRALSCVAWKKPTTIHRLMADPPNVRPEKKPERAGLLLQQLNWWLKFDGLHNKNYSSETWHQIFNEGSHWYYICSNQMHWIISMNFLPVPITIFF